MNDLEKKIIDEYVFEKYNKHIIGTVDEKVDNLLSKIKEKENNLFKSIKEKKNKDYLLLKESNDKIQSVYKNINDIFINYYLFLKEINQIFSIDLNNLKYQINTAPTKDENNNNNNENIVCSKSDYELQEKDLIRMQYHIKLIRNNKIYFKNYQNDKLKDNNLQNNENYGKDYLLLNDKEIYDIISKFYSYDLKILDKSKYNLEDQKGKLIAMELSNHILTYSENNESTISKLKEKYNEILQSINSKIINNLINIEKFFVALNNYRVSTKIEFSPYPHDKNDRHDKNPKLVEIQGFSDGGPLSWGEKKWLTNMTKINEVELCERNQSSRSS